MSARSRTTKSHTSSVIWGMAGTFLFMGGFLAVLVYFDANDEVVRLLRWVEDQGVWAPVLFIAIMMLVVILLIPGVFFTLGAGFVFGVVEGSIYVVLGTTLGASVAFLIARFFFGKKTEEFLKSRTKLQFVSDEMTPNGWKIVLLSRLIPFFPSKLANYFFGLTKFSLRGFFMGSLIGYIPFTINSVYLGSLMADVAEAAEGKLERSPLQWTVYGLGFVAAAGAAIYVSRLSRRALAKYSKQQEPETGTESKQP